MTRRLAGILAGLMLTGLVGCGADMTPVTLIDVTGNLTDSGGKPIKDVGVFFQAMGRGTQPTTMKTDASGAFGGKIVAGKYTWYVVASEGKSASMKSIPESYKEGSEQRLIDVESGAVLKLEVK